MSTDTQTEATTQKTVDATVKVTLEHCMPAAMAIDLALDELKLPQQEIRLGVLMGAVGLIFARYGAVLIDGSPSFRVAVQTNKVACETFAKARAEKLATHHAAPTTQQ